MRHFLSFRLQGIGLIFKNQRSRSQLLLVLAIVASLVSHKSLDLSFDGGVFEFIGSEPDRNTGINPVQVVCAAGWLGIMVFILQPLYASKRINRSSWHRVLKIGMHYRNEFVNQKYWLPLRKLRKIFDQFQTRFLGAQSSRSQTSQHQISNQSRKNSQFHSPFIESMVFSSNDSAEVANFVEQLEASSADLISISRSAIVSEVAESALEIQPVHVPKVELRSINAHDSSVSIAPSDLTDHTDQSVLLDGDQSPMLWHFFCDAEPVPMTEKSYVVQRSVLLNFLQLLHWSNQDANEQIASSTPSDLQSREAIKAHASGPVPSPQPS